MRNLLCIALVASLFSTSSCTCKGSSTKKKPSTAEPPAKPTTTVLKGQNRSLVPDPAKLFPPDDILVTLLWVRLDKKGKGSARTLALPKLSGSYNLAITVTGTFAERQGRTPRTKATLAPLTMALELNATAEALRFQGLEGSVAKGGANEKSPRAAKNLLEKHQAFVNKHGGTLSVEKNGLLANVAVDKPARSVWETRREVARMWAEYVPVLPAKPIAIGGSWSVALSIPTAGTFIKQTATYTLTARNKKGFKANIRWRQIGQQQSMMSPTTPADVQVDMIGMVAERTGTLVVKKAGTLQVHYKGWSSLHGRVAKPTGKIVDFTADREGTVTFRLTAKKQP